MYMRPAGEIDGEKPILVQKKKAVSRLLFYLRWGQFSSLQPWQVPQPPLPLRMREMAQATRQPRPSRMRMSERFTAALLYTPRAMATSCTARAATQAMAHCHSTTYTAQRRPSSRRMAATAATQGV